MNNIYKKNEKLIDTIIIFISIGWIIMEPDPLPFVGWDDGAMGALAVSLLDKYRK